MFYKCRWKACGPLSWRSSHSAPGAAGVWCVLFSLLSLETQRQIQRVCLRSPGTLSGINPQCQGSSRWMWLKEGTTWKMGWRRPYLHTLLWGILIRPLFQFSQMSGAFKETAFPLNGLSEFIIKPPPVQQPGQHEMWHIAKSLNVKCLIWQVSH